MKYRILLSLCMILGLSFGAKAEVSSLYDYGLYFRSHTVKGTERTTLYLDDNRPFPVKDDFTVSFRMYIRDNEVAFGPIIHLQTNTGLLLHLSFIGNEETHWPALVFDEEIVPIEVPIECGRWIDVSMQLRRKENKVEVAYDGKSASASVHLERMESVQAIFGMMESYLPDVPPVNIRDVRVWQDGKQTREWKLWKHDDALCYDELHGMVARAQYPSWLIDNHIEWKLIYQAHIPEKLDVAFDARLARFFLVGQRKVTILNQEGVALQDIPVGGGYPAIGYSNHLVYDTLSNQLVSYSLRRSTASFFSFKKGMWSNRAASSDEPRYYNHARAFNPADSSFYFFGGYGFYQYRNELYRMKPASREIEQVKYEPPFHPRFSAAMGVAGDELYIFGGRGNKYGKQELTSGFYHELCALNLKTHQSRVVWKRLLANENTIMASTMYFEPSDSSFYAVSMDKGGTLWKVSVKDSVCTEVSKPIGNLSNYQDLDFGLYASPAYGKLFLVMDKILSDRSHDVSIYSINMPLVDEADIRQILPEETASSGCWPVYLTVGGAALFLLAVLLFVRFRKRTSHSACMAQAKEMPDREVKVETPSGEESSSTHIAEPRNLPVSYYDRSRSAVSLLGCFNVRDRQGNDITASFTPRLKHLLVLLVLYTENHSQGISASRVTEILWPDKEETSARNNRNVTLRKLRLLLESIGDVEVVAENNFLRIRWGDDVCCDYHAALACIRRFREREEDELLDRILELLLLGPLLPNTIQDWVDNFKDAYSSSAIDLLRDLLELELQRGHQDMVLRLADIMFLHDPLNEEALSAKCSVLSAQGKKGIARNVYDRFCKEYRESMGEAYKVKFADL